MCQTTVTPDELFAIRRYGDEETKQQWLPRMATGEAIGCQALTGHAAFA
jgi:alkylation response protein AidB-like acyl-CoA dehydrogenase